jgi:hypothetical protein
VEHAFTTVDARGPVAEVFHVLCEVIEPLVQDMATFEAVAVNDRPLPRLP